MPTSLVPALLYLGTNTAEDDNVHGRCVAQGTVHEASYQLCVSALAQLDVNIRAQTAQPAGRRPQNAKENAAACELVLPEQRGPLDNKFLRVLIWRQKKHLFIAGDCRAQLNLATPAKLQLSALTWCRACSHICNLLQPRFAAGQRHAV